MTTPIRPRLPAPALAAAVTGMISATLCALEVLVVLVMLGGELAAADWLVVLVPVGTAGLLVAGVVLLLLGRSWLALCLPAGALAVVALAAVLVGGLGPVFVLAFLVALATAVLAVLPDVQRWVDDSRHLREAAPPVGSS